MERELWSQGCETWTDYLAGGYTCGNGTKSAAKHLEASRRALELGEHQYFAKKLKQKHAWRAFPAFRTSCAYLDIETTGDAAGTITVCGLWDGVDFHGLVQDEDLGNFPDLISRYSMIVTFCGTSFDLPMLKKSFGNLPLDQIHIDLHPALASIGIRGGLKKIEKAFGIERDPAVDGLTGYDAVKLWRRYRSRRDDRAMETLLAYNRADCVNMERLAEIAYARLAHETLYGWRTEGQVEVQEFSVSADRSLGVTWRHRPSRAILNG
jgi:uncharacterized protein YprB with RNaseH-like and TPR domain